MAATDIVTFVLRLLLGTLFVAAGVLKAGHFNELAAAIAGPLAVLLPFFEMGLGAYLIAGLFTRGAAIVASVQLLIYAAVIASAVVRHIPANCGCFGPRDSAPADWPHVAVDAALAAVCAALAWRAPGPFSVDERIGRR